MAYKFEEVQESYQANLALFRPKPVDTGIEHMQWIEYRKVSQLSHGSFIEFNVPPTSMAYFDLSKTRLHIKARIVKTDGTLVTENDMVAFVNLPLQSIWRQVDCIINQVNVSPKISTFYANKAFLNCLLTHSEARLELQIYAQAFFKDTARFMKSTDPVLGANSGLAQRFLWTKDGNSMDMESPLQCDIMMQEHSF